MKPQPFRTRVSTISSAIMGQITLGLAVGWRELWIFGCFLGLTSFMTWPWVSSLRNAVSDTGDPYVIAWTLWWNYHQTFNDPLGLFHPEVFYPFQYSLAFSEHDYGIAVLFFPLFVAGLKPLTVHSIATFVGFAFCGYGAFRLTRTVTKSSPAGWVAGIVFAFIPYRFQLLSHLHYLFAGWLPLTLEALFLFIRVPTRKRAAWLGFTFLMNGLTCITWMIYSLLPMALSAIVLIIRNRTHRNPLLWKRGLVGLAIAFLLLAPFLWPYYKVGRLYDFRWPTSETARYSAGFSDWFSAEPRNQLWRRFGEKLPNVTSHLFPGLLPLLLPLAAVLLVMPPRNPVHSDQEGVTSHARNEVELTTITSKANTTLPNQRSIERWLPVLDSAILASFIIALLGIGYHDSDMGFFRGGTADRALFILTATIFLRLSISYPQVFKRGGNRNLIESLRSRNRKDGYWIGIIWVVIGFVTTLGPTIFFNRLLNEYLLPYRSLRAPARAAMLCYLGLAVLSGIGAIQIATKLALKRKPLKVWITCTVLIAALVYELRAIPLVIVRGAVDPDALTLVLKETSMRGGLVELPTTGPAFPLHHAMLRAAEHRKPLVNAVSTFMSVHSRRIEELSNQTVIPTNELLDYLEGVPTSYVAVRHRMIPAHQREAYSQFLTAARTSGRFRLAGSYDNGDELYLVTKTEPEAR